MTSCSTKNSLKIAAGAALALGLLGGCAGNGMAVRSNSADSARVALAKGQPTKALASAEAAVAATPRDASLRVLLGQVYFKSGRFQSAAATFDDAMKLGDNSARTALSLALAKIGAGDQNGALAVLEDWRSEIPASDLGLALALAGEPERGVAIMADALRGGENTPKIRQNLAYAYALSGRWKEARVMASQDVPADQLDKRITEWAGMIQPEQYQQRVAALVGTPLRSDPGLPAMLALSNNPALEQVATETTANAAAPVGKEAAVATASTELPAAGEAAPAASLVIAEAPAAAPQVDETPPATAMVAPVQTTTYISAPQVQATSTRTARATTGRIAKPAPTKVSGTHLVQLGSFSSPQGARRAWGIYSARNSALSSYRMTITPAVVRGKNVWRVAAGGLTGSGAANGLCSSVKKGGGVCFAYAAPARGKSPASPLQQRDVSAPQMARRR